MKIGDTVCFQAGLDRHIEMGELVAVNPLEETGTILSGGKYHIRVLGRIRTVERGMKEQARRDKQKGLR